MAHRTSYSKDAMYSDIQTIYGHMTGGGAAADGVLVSGDVTVMDYVSTGVFNLTFKNKYPQGVMPHKPNIVGTTTGLSAIFTAWDPEAGTATVKFSVGSVATDPATTDSIYFAFDVRNSGANPASI